MTGGQERLPRRANCKGRQDLRVQSLPKGQGRQSQVNGPTTVYEHEKKRSIR